MAELRKGKVQGLPIAALGDLDASAQVPVIKTFCRNSNSIAMDGPAAESIIMDLALHGDGGFWLDRVITPMFMVLAHEVSPTCSFACVKLLP